MPRKPQKPVELPRQMPQVPVKFVRWYDKYDNLSRIMAITEMLPAPIQSQIARSLYAMAQHYRDEAHAGMDFRSMGSESILNLYKSKRKQRWYDAIPQLNDALNMMTLMPHVTLLKLDTNCVSLLQLAEHHRMFSA